MTSIQAQSRTDHNPWARSLAVGAVATVATAAVTSKAIFADVKSLKAPGPWLMGALLVGAPLAAIDYGNHHGAANSLRTSALIGAAPAAVLGGALGLVGGALAHGDSGGSGGLGYVIGGTLLFGAMGAVAGSIAHEVDKHT